MAKFKIEEAIRLSVELLADYRKEYGHAPFPVLKDRLFRLIENRVKVDKLRVDRFKTEKRPILGQLRRINERPAPYADEEEIGWILLCPSMSLALQRFVMVKEASHLMLDTPEDYVTKEADLDKLMVCLAQFSSEEVSQHFDSELLAMVVAREVLLPFSTRQVLVNRYKSGEISPAQIADEAQFPVELVKPAMSDRWRELITPIYDSIEAERAEPVLEFVGDDSDG